MKLIASALVATALVGALEALSIGLKLHVSDLALGTLIGMGIALPIGLVLSAGVLFVCMSVRRFPVPERLGAFVRRCVPGGMEPRIERFFELVLPFVLFVLPFSYGALRLGFAPLQVLQDATLASHLSVLVALAVVSLGVVMSGALFHAVSKEGRARRTFLRLLPRRSIARLALLAWLPVIFLIAPLVHVYRDELGGIGVLGVWGTWFLTWFLLAIVPTPRLAFLERKFLAVLLLVTPAVALFGASLVAFAAEPRLGQQLAASPMIRLGATWVAEISDIDRDGSSSLLAGGDCEPLDPNIGPGAQEIPENGVDEDCNGDDEDGDDEDDRPRRAAPRKPQVFSRALPESVAPPYDIVWIVIDALRADAVGSRIAQRSSTPELDAIQAESLHFSNAQSQSSATRFSFPSMLSGRDVAALKWKKRGKVHVHTGADPLVATLLHETGYDTAIVVNGYITTRLPSLLQGYDAKFNSWKGFEPRYWENRSGPVTSALAITYLEERAKRLARQPKDKQEPPPYFLSVYYEGPHSPYGRSGHGLPEFPGSPRGAYSHEVAYTDRQLGVLMDYLRAQKRWDRTVVVVTADHGEEFNEHGGKSHSRTCYIESTHVPLFVRIPGVTPRKVSAPVGLVDIVPTLLELAGETDAAKNRRLDGQSLLIPALEPKRAWRDRPLFCAVMPASSKAQKLIVRSVRRGNDSLVVNDETKQTQLFDRAKDPAEATDLAAERQALVSELKALLDERRTGNL